MPLPPAQLLPVLLVLRATLEHPQWLLLHRALAAMPLRSEAVLAPQRPRTQVNFTPLPRFLARRQGSLKLRRSPPLLPLHCPVHWLRPLPLLLTRFLLTTAILTPFLNLTDRLLPSTASNGVNFTIPPQAIALPLGELTMRIP
jgi:hypothetical protein